MPLSRRRSFGSSGQVYQAKGDTGIVMESPDEVLEPWGNVPESKLELINGQLIISTLAGSRQVAWHILSDYGPVLALPLASPELWWAALREVFQPKD